MIDICYFYDTGLPTTRPLGNVLYLFLFTDLSSFAVVSQLQVTRGFALEDSDHVEAMVPIGGRSESWNL